MERMPMTEDEIYDGLVSKNGDEDGLKKWMFENFEPHDYITMLKMVGTRITFEDVKLPKE